MLFTIIFMNYLKKKVINIKLLIDNSEINLFKCIKPKMTWHRGRTWDIVTSIIINDKITNIHLDTTWGKYGYLQIENFWYKINIVDIDNLKYNKIYNLQK